MSFWFAEHLNRACSLNKTCLGPLIFNPKAWVSGTGSKKNWYCWENNFNYVLHFYCNKTSIKFLLIKATNVVACFKICLSLYGSGTWHSNVSWPSSWPARCNNSGFKIKDRVVFQPEFWTSFSKPSLESIHFSFKGSISTNPEFTSSSSRSAWWEVNLNVSWPGRLLAEALHVNLASWSCVNSSGPSIVNLSGGSEKYILQNYFRTKLYVAVPNIYLS